MLSLDIGTRIHRLALEYLKERNQDAFNEVKGLLEEANALNVQFSFGGTGRMFHKKLMQLIAEVEAKFDAEKVQYITELISIADWMNLFIDKTSIENEVFPLYKEFTKDVNGKLSGMKPMFSWLNFEV